LTIINDDISGKNLVILDKNNKVCLTGKTGVYIKNKFFSANPKTGIVKLPE